VVTKAEILIAGKDISQAAFASASRSLDGLRSKAETTRSGLAGVATAVAGAVAALQVKSSIDMLDQLDDLQEKTGISVEKLSELRFAGESVGTPFEALAGGVGRLSKLMAEAAGGNKEAAATFKALKVEVQNADGTLRTNEEVLGDLADRFSGYEDGAEKAALAQRVFGKSGAEMIPFLNQGRDGIEKLRIEAEKLGAIYGGALAKDAADFNDNLTKLKLSSEAAAIAVGGPFLKSLVSISAQMLEARKEAGLLQAILITIGGTMSRTLGIDEIGAVQKRAQAAVSEQKRLEGLRNGPELQLQRDPGNEMARRRLETYNKKIQEQVGIANAASAELKRLADRDDPMGSGQKGREERGWTPDIKDPKAKPPIVATGGGGAEKKAKDDEAAAKRYIESLDKQREKVKELSEVEVALAEIQRIRAQGGEVTEAQKQRILQLAAEIDITKERTAAEKEAAHDREENQRRTIALIDEGKKLYEATLTPLEAYNAAVEHLNGLREQGVISTQTYVRALAKEGEELTEAQKKLAAQGDEFSKRAAGNIQDSLGQGLNDALDGNFKDIGDNFGKMLKRMVSEAIAADISRAMFGDLVEGGKGKGSFGGVLGSIGQLLTGTSLGGGYSAADMSALDGMAMAFSGPGRAAGGTVYGGETYMVGEQGPELFKPGVVGSITPNHALGGGVTNNYYTVGDIPTMSKVKEFVAATQAQSTGRFVRSRRMGGEFA
jgi:hypothetical protein